jgi:hypothetical protein
MVMPKDKNVGKMNKLTPIAEESQLIGQAVQAGRDRTAMYQDAAERMRRDFDLASQSVAQQTPRLLATAGAFNTTGGNVVDAARGIAPVIGDTRAKLSMTGTDALSKLGAAQFDSAIDDAEYGLSAMPHVRQSKKVLGYVQLHKDMRDKHGDAEADRRMMELLGSEIDPKVKQDTMSVLGIGGAPAEPTPMDNFLELVTFGLHKSADEK